MYTINSNIIYGSNGVCTITDIRKENFFGEEKDYYILKPTYTEGSIFYVPIDSELLTGRMRHILTLDEIYGLIQVMPDERTAWIQDNRLRNERYKEILAKSDSKELVQLIKTIYTRKQEQLAIRKKLGAVDESSLAKALKILYNEFSLVISIEPEDVVPFIFQQIQRDETDI
jgi:Transcriptional regulators, similar to M. xanthus CarD